MSRQFHFYETGPIDFGWEHLDDFSPSNPFTEEGGLFKQILSDFQVISEVAKGYMSIGLVCRFSEGPKVFWLPNPFDRRFEYGFVWRQRSDGNPDGVTFIASPYEMPWLGLHILAHEVIVVDAPAYDSFVYFIYAEALGRVKIGTSKNPKRRIAQMGSSIPCELKLLKSFPGDAAMKRGLHHKLEHIRHSGEWFEATDELLAWTQSHGAR